MKTKLSWLERIMAAVTFAEANEHATAKEFLVGTGSTAGNQRRCQDCDPILATDLHGANANS
jgi:hypothetical protein